MKVITANNVSKNYGKVTALKGASFEVEKGEIFGFIGPDGAGKTSLFRIIVSLLDPSAGDIRVLGFNPVTEFKKLRSLLGYMPGRFSLYQDLSIEENLNFFASIFGVDIKKNYYLIEDIYKQIEPFKNRPAGKLSGGMKQKLALSCALIHKPELLVLDEPTTGVDAVSRIEFWEMLKRLKDLDITIVVSTPYMDEAELCDRCALIQDGELFDTGSPQEITSKFDGDLYAMKADSQYLLLNSLKKYEFTRSVHPFGEFLHYSDKRVDISFENLNCNLLKEIDNNLIINKITPTLEDAFIRFAEGK